MFENIKVIIILILFCAFVILSLMALGDYIDHEYYPNSFGLYEHK